MEIFKELNKKGYKHYYEGTIEELDLMDKNNPYLHSEIMQVIMWLYEKHEIWISIARRCNCFNIESIKKYIEFDDLNKELDLDGLDFMDFKTPTEAYEKAIEYTLKNLI